MDTRLRNLLHDLATEMPVDVERSARPTLRRARGRRVLAGAGAVVAVVAFIAVSVSAFRLVSDPTIPATTGPNPPAGDFPALWPETDAEALAELQLAVDDGHQPLRTTPDGTASLLAVNLLRWPESDVLIESTAVDGDAAAVVISNRVFGDNVPPISVELRQLGQTGPNGAWSVIGVSTPLIEIGELEEIMPESPEMGGFLILSGSVTDVFDGAPAIEAHVFDGPALVPSLGSSRQELTDRRFDFTREVSVEATPDGRATLLITVPDATGASLGAVMVGVETPVGEHELPQGPNLEGLPPDVAATAQAIFDGATARDLDALAALLDPVTFISDLGDGGDPIPAWREDPKVFDLIIAVLRLPPTSRDIGPGYGTFYFWPYLVNSDFDDLSEQERADLRALGLTDRDIELMIQGGHGYQGPRLAIDETGEWRNFLTVGE